MPAVAGSPVESSDRRATRCLLGLGAMGRRIARRLFDAKVDLTIWNRTASAASGLTELGHELRQAMQRYSAAREAGLGSANLVAIAKLMR